MDGGWLARMRLQVLRHLRQPILSTFWPSVSIAEAEPSPAKTSQTRLPLCVVVPSLHLTRSLPFGTRDPYIYAYTRGGDTDRH